MNKEILHELDFISGDIERCLNVYSVLLMRISELTLDVYELDKINVEELLLAYTEYKKRLAEINCYTDIMSDYLKRLQEKQNDIDNVVHYISTHIA